MLSIERHEQILQILMEKKSVTVGELSKTMFVSDATIRRDLSQMEKEGLIKRSHGGAVLFESTNDETLSSCGNRKISSKKRSLRKSR